MPIGYTCSRQMRRPPTPARVYSFRMTLAEPIADSDQSLESWPGALHRVLRRAGVSQANYLPDAGHAELINLLLQDPDVTATVLTTEEEGVAIAAGAWLGGARSVVLMQSSGVGNCINMLSLPVMAQIPLLCLVTMRGEWAEFNPWQAPMGQATAAALHAIGVRTFRADSPGALLEIASAAVIEAFESNQQIAILIGQRMLGEKKW
jgi:sulfopyruvate decarboxylase alpha subunit